MEKDRALTYFDVMPEKTSRDIRLEKEAAESAVQEEQEEQGPQVISQDLKQTLALLGVLVTLGVGGIATCNGIFSSLKSKDERTDSSSDFFSRFHGYTRSPEAASRSFDFSERPDQVSGREAYNTISQQDVFESIKRGLIRNGALVVAADDTQYNEAISYFRRYDGRAIADRGRLNISFRRSRVGTKINVPVGRMNIPIYVIKAADLNTRAGRRFTGNRRFSVASGRGHTGDMGNVIGGINSRRSTNALVDLGGCASRSLKSQVCNPRTPTITQNGTGYGIRNSKLMLRLVTEIPRVRNWEQMFARIHRFENSTGEVNNMPGQPGYGNDCTAWNQTPRTSTRRSVAQSLRFLEGKKSEWRKWKSKLQQVIVAMELPFAQKTLSSSLAAVKRQEATANQEVSRINRLIADIEQQRTSRRRRGRRVGTPAGMQTRTERNRARRRRRGMRRGRRSRRRR